MEVCPRTTWVHTMHGVLRHPCRLCCLGQPKRVASLAHHAPRRYRQIDSLHHSYKLRTADTIGENSCPKVTGHQPPLHTAKEASHYRYYTPGVMLDFSGQVEEFTLLLERPG